jgi:hypothetical protein
MSDDCGGCSTPGFGPAGGSSDHKVMVDSSDTTPNFLSSKLAVSGLATAILNAAGNEQLQLSVLGFKATYYVNPLFSGVAKGSQSNPFTTIAACYADATASGFTSTIIYLNPGASLTENVTFPASGNHEISGLSSASQGFTPVITGTLTIPCTASSRYGITNLDWEGNISGTISSGPISRFYVTNAFVTGTVTLANTGTGIWRMICNGPYADGTLGASTGSAGVITGAVSVAGLIFTNNWDFRLGVTSTASLNSVNFVGWNTTFHNAAFAAVNGAATANCAFYDCTFPTNFAITSASGTLNMFFDGVSMSNLLSSGIATPSGTVKFKTLNSNNTSDTTITGNVGSTALGGKASDGLYELAFDATLLVAGTTGTIVVNSIYTDKTGTLVTVPVGTTLLITAAAGTKASGILQFHHNGTTAPAFSVTGVTTAGALSVSLIVTLRRVS